VLVAAAALLAGCQQDLTGSPLRIATGGGTGVYYQLGGKLAEQWHAKLGLDASAHVTNGSVGNLKELHDRKADMALVAADAAGKDNKDNKGVRALARVYDDYIQVIARADSGIDTLADLAGKRVSIGGPDSGVTVVATNLLRLAKLPPTTDRMYQSLALPESLEALKDNKIDAFFWSGGLPTPAITDALRNGLRLRMVNLTSLVNGARSGSYYDAATVPKTAYNGMEGIPTTTLVVHNLLMVREDMPAGEAESLVRTLFDVQPTLARDGNPVVANAAQLIDVRSAIETAPIELHDGALTYYRSVKE
jgi:uncharacterized protein